MFFERPDASACSEPVIALQDIGATFGGAGRTSKSNSKMNLKAWTNRTVFKPAKSSDSGGVAECHGSLTVSMAAGDDARGDPRIGEAGRAFLQERLSLLTDAHVRALMTTARVEKLSETHEWEDPHREISRRVGRVGRCFQGQGTAYHRAALRAVALHVAIKHAETFNAKKRKKDQG